MLAAILGQVGDAAGHRLPRRANIACLAVEDDRAGCRRLDAEERQADIGASGADQAGEAEDLAAADVEADVMKDALTGEAAHGQDQVALLDRGARLQEPDLATDHVGDRPARRHLGARSRRDQATGAEHRDLVGDLENLLHAMTDEQDGDALVAEVLDQLEQLGDLVGGKRGGRLVHDQDANVERDRLADLDRLLRGKRQPARRTAHVEGHAERRQNVLGLAEHLPPISVRAAALMADEDVLGDVVIREEERLLIDGGDAMALRLGGAADDDRLAGQANLAAIGLIDAGHDLDQRRLAGAVLPEKGMHLAGIERQRDGLERLRGAETLGNVMDFEDGRDSRLSTRLCTAFRQAHPIRLPHSHQERLQAPLSSHSRIL